VLNENHKAQYRHFWSYMWGHIYNEQRRSLLAKAEYIDRASTLLGWIVRMVPEPSCVGGVLSITIRYGMIFGCGIDGPRHEFSFHKRKRRIQRINEVWAPS
jgi:hypothetical protein